MARRLAVIIQVALAVVATATVENVSVLGQPDLTGASADHALSATQPTDPARSLSSCMWCDVMHRIHDGFHRVTQEVSEGVSQGAREVSQGTQEVSEGVSQGAHQVSQGVVRIGRWVASNGVAVCQEMAKQALEDTVEYIEDRASVLNRAACGDLCAWLDTAVDGAAGAEGGLDPIADAAGAAITAGCPGACQDAAERLENMAMQEGIPPLQDQANVLCQEIPGLS